MNQKIRIKLKSFDHNLVDKSAEKIVKTVPRWLCWTARATTPCSLRRMWMSSCPRP